jgi:predicted methyltransferase
VRRWLLLLALGCVSACAANKGAPASLNIPFVDPALNVDTWTGRFEGESREVYRERTRIVDALKLKPGMTIADVGTGTGLFVAYFSKAVGPTGRVFAVDISPKFVESVARRAAAAGLSNVQARLSQQTDVDLPAGSVDVLYVCDTYHHFEDTRAILKTIATALKPGGQFVVVDYHRIEGKTRPFLMKHIRANQETFAAEIEGAGFVRLKAPPAPFLSENYLMVFRRPQ